MALIHTFGHLPSVAHVEAPYVHADIEDLDADHDAIIIELYDELGIDVTFKVDDFRSSISFTLSPEAAERLGSILLDSVDAEEAEAELAG